MENKISNYAIILASGTGSRYGADLPKQFSKIGEKTILEYTLSVFENNENIDKIILVVTPNFIDFVQKIVENMDCKKVEKIIENQNLILEKLAELGWYIQRE